jgi:hypothetical protein
MSNNLQLCMEKLKIISKIKDPRLRKKILIEIADDCLYKALNEIAVNTISKKVPLNRATKTKLRKYKTHIKALASKTKNKRLQKKLVVQSGGFLPLLVPAVASILGSVLSAAINRR